MASTKFSIDDKALPQTPANEWADETTAALNTESPLDSIRPPFESADSTPGMPGGYGKAKPSEQPPIAETAANAAASVTTAATGLLASAAQYIPQSVASYFPGAPTVETSLPSQETDGHLTSSDGVGSLPGGAGETSVAKLPEERAVQDSIPLSSGGVGDLPGSAHESGVVKLPEERALEKGTAAITGGVGNLPGGPGETEVARLPEERAVESSFSHTGASDPRTSFLTPATNPSTVRSDTDSSSEFSTRAADGSVAATPAREMSIPFSTPTDKSPLSQSTIVSFQDSIKTPQASETQPQVRHSQSSFEKKSGRKETNLVSEAFSTLPPQANTEGRLYPLSGNPAVYSNADNTPAPPLPITSSTTAEVGHGESNSISPAGSPSKSSFSASSKHTDTGIGSNGSLGRKTKFMDKVKGEVKVISGKLGHNEAKVEEGKRMMGK